MVPPKVTVKPQSKRQPSQQYQCVLQIVVLQPRQGPPHIGLSKP